MLATQHNRCLPITQNVRSNNTVQGEQVDELKSRQVRRVDKLDELTS